MSLTAQFAIPPEGCNDYLTPGKKYPIRSSEDPRGFYTTSDLGHEMFCLWRGCAHAHGDWTPA